MNCKPKAIIFSYILLIFSHAAEIIPTKSDKSLLIKSSTDLEQLDEYGKIVLGWALDLLNETITFEIEAETTGYVGFGLSPHGTMKDADMFIGGIWANGTPYHSDSFSTKDYEVISDNKSDWVLLKAEEQSIVTNSKGGQKQVVKTYLKFTRKWETCDDQDFPVKKDLNRLIWSLGETDEIDYHGQDDRGTKSINFFRDPNPKTVDLTGTKSYELVSDTVMPEDEFSFWCTFHQIPTFSKKHHIVSWTPYLPDLNAKIYVNRLTVYNCTNIDETFKNFTIDKYQGDNCFEGTDEFDPPIEYCNEFLFTWARGGKEMTFPENVGLPLGMEEEKQYYMLEINYANPGSLTDVRFKAGVTVHYTDNLRPIDAGLLWIGHETNLALIVPPNVTDFVVSGHCSPSCSRQFPKDGIKVFSILLHAHLSGRKLRLRHFRRNSLSELPYIEDDQHYDFNYQQNKELTEPLKILPGDQITLECTYDSHNGNGSVGIGSLSVSDEMCQSVLWYYPKMPIEICGSTYPLEESFLDFGIMNYTNVSTSSGHESIEVTDPSSLLGEFENVLNTKYNWTKLFIQLFAVKRRYALHEILCSDKKGTTQVMEYKSAFTGKKRISKISYPIVSKVKPYHPKMPWCAKPESGHKIKVDNNQNSSSHTARSSFIVVIILVGINAQIYKQ